mgnify:FL=1
MYLEQRIIGYLGTLKRLVSHISRKFEGRRPGAATPEQRKRDFATFPIRNSTPHDDQNHPDSPPIVLPFQIFLWEWPIFYSRRGSNNLLSLPDGRSRLKRGRRGKLAALPEMRDNDRKRSLKCIRQAYRRTPEFPPVPIKIGSYYLLRSSWRTRETGYEAICWRVIGTRRAEEAFLASSGKAAHTRRDLFTTRSLRRNARHPPDWREKWVPGWGTRGRSLRRGESRAGLLLLKVAG